MKNRLRRLLERIEGDGSHGSALLVSLMVMVGLSLLGLGFVAISETESAIAINERNSVQVLDVAETGAKTVVEWFNNPTWARNAGLMPANAAGAAGGMKQERKSIINDEIAGTTYTYTGYYRPDTGKLLFDLPFKGDPDNRFYGLDEKSADIVINNTTAASFLTTFNQRLFRDNIEGGQVTEILIYAPPVLKPYSPALTEHPASSGKNFWNQAVRYGVATIKVTAQKTLPANCIPGTDSPCQLVAQRSVKLVVSEFPFPGPEGPLQSNAGITMNGAFRVHWGKTISLGSLAVKREMISIPWLNADTPMRYEWGYNNAAYGGGGQPQYLLDLIGKSFEDPWFQARARGDIVSDGGIVASAPPPPYGTGPVVCTGCQPDPYDSINDIETEGAYGSATQGGWSNQFQDQTADILPYRKEVIFPRIDYKFWKQVALAGSGQSGIFYLKYDSASGKFKDRAGNVKTFGEWTNTQTGAKEGFYFFDTTTGSNPQRADGTTNTAILTPQVNLNNADGNPFLMKGFIYLNAVKFGSTGLGGPAKQYNAPAEPFRDIGYWKVNETTGVQQLDGLGAPVLVNDTNYKWDYQDLPLTTATGGTFLAAGVKNDRFDYVVASDTRTGRGTDNAGGSSITDLFIVPYTPGCNVGTDCSEPHEPYLNLIYGRSTALTDPYPDACCQAAGQPNGHIVKWQLEAAQTRRPKKFQSDGVTPVACTANGPYTTGGSSADDCTHNGYDDVGALFDFSTGANDHPNLDGVFYNEGGYEASGSSIYYGSVLVRGLIDQVTGTVDVWFDDRLRTGDWQKRFSNLARVVITSHETDQ